mmetsp:Transcript_22777/g.54052  ORF Transcript_22777/g.54052 Transcript_22777/m.54052 type:complete len:206 (-) Transcript_22777:40-657(-)
MFHACNALRCVDVFLFLPVFHAVEFAAGACALQLLLALSFLAEVLEEEGVFDLEFFLSRFHPGSGVDGHGLRGLPLLPLLPLPLALPRVLVHKLVQEPHGLEVFEGVAWVGDFLALDEAGGEEAHCGVEVAAQGLELPEVRPRSEGVFGVAFVRVVALLVGAGEDVEVVCLDAQHVDEVIEFDHPSLAIQGFDHSLAAVEMGGVD